MSPFRNTIGIGHNMGPEGVEQGKAEFEQVTGADYEDVKAGIADLTDEQVDKLFAHDLDKHIKRAQKEVSNFDKLPVEAKEVVVDLVFNMGSLSKFTDLKEALGREAFRQAAWDLGHKTRAKESPESLYKQQVPNRAQRNIDLLEQLADEANEPALFPNQ